MFDGIKLLDVSVDVDLLLKNDRLTFGALVDTQTGFIFDPTRRAFDRGLTFRLIPRQTDQRYRLEVKGSLHKFHNDGQHNADQFTVTNLLRTLDELATNYGFNLSKSKINNVEFGVNVELPFSVSQVLKNLVSYKNQPFHLDTNSETPYYVCKLQRYVVKIYDKGKQRGLNANLLRFEIRVRKMEYFNDTGINIRTLADLSNVANYGLLGALLVDAFNEILFNDPTIKTARLPPDEQEIYRNGCNPHYWQTPDDLPSKQASTHRQRMSRDRRRYRTLFDQYGGKWKGEVAALIGQTWSKLTDVDDHLLTQINERRASWQDLIKPDISIHVPRAKICHELTGSNFLICDDSPGSCCHKLTDPSTPDLSRINPLYSGLDCDTNQPGKPTTEPPCQPLKPGAVVCLVTGIVIDFPRPRQRFVSATQLKNLHTTDRHTFGSVAAQFLTVKQAGANLDQQCYYMAHNIRNAYTNQFNNPLRRLKKYLNGNKRPVLFTLNKAQLTDRIQAGIEYREGTRYEVNL